MKTLIEEYYKKYTNTYEIECRECSSILGVRLLKELHMLEDLTLDEFKEKLNNNKFKEKWGPK
jgi:hypothetical protein